MVEDKLEYLGHDLKEISQKLFAEGLSRRCVHMCVCVCVYVMYKESLQLIFQLKSQFWKAFWISSLTLF